MEEMQVRRLLAGETCHEKKAGWGEQVVSVATTGRRVPRRSLQGQEEKAAMRGSRGWWQVEQGQLEQAVAMRGSHRCSPGYAGLVAKTGTRCRRS